jgi:hypothetical protein
MAASLGVTGSSRNSPIPRELFRSRSAPVNMTRMSGRAARVKRANDRPIDCLFLKNSLVIRNSTLWAAMAGAGWICRVPLFHLDIILCGTPDFSASVRVLVGDVGCPGLGLTTNRWAETCTILDYRVA